MKQRIRYQLSIGLLFLVLGLFLSFDTISGYLRERRVLGAQQPVTTAPAPAPASPVPPARIEGKPVQIRLERLGIDVTVADGHFNAKSKSWTLSDNKAHFAVITTLPNNQAGNTFIYGHNRKQVFAKLSGLKAGDKAIVQTDNGHTFIYIYQSVRETTPEDTSIFSYQGAPILTLQTCSGLWYQNRSLYTFALEEVR